ncbi:hypothetical protein MKQ70_08455 [Chitinophaga sedimenti]|uniref:hypothetical protein n=1 Tax=Chitinophaga sedimenti TaxID=2033606 RepID=UPI0020058836|nr:hypothetical protein [Chitinophaga sedimenti]MCK7555037.1 hypothetical protein [Chitinophaga sedimenti]
MAHVDNNIFIEGLRGNVAKQIVFRKTRKGTVASRMPKTDPNREPTQGQLEHRDRFADASDYAQEVLADPELKALYEAALDPENTLRGTIVRDFFKAPKVREVDTDSYKGVVGDVIRIKAKDDFRVIAVDVRILNAAGELLEEGAAIIDPKSRKKWLYTTTVPNPELAGTVIQVTATDMPGNTGSLDVTL